MAMYNVYSHPEYRRYRASICSKATVFMFFMYVFTFIVPVLIVYRSNGLWVDTFTYTEQPDIDYKHKVLSIVSISNRQLPNPSYLTWSTYPQYNAIHQANLRVPLVKSREEDSNRDGLKDKFILDLEFPLADNEDVHQLSLLTFFECRLKRKAVVMYEGMALVQAQSHLPGAAFSVLGDLKLKQVNPIAHKGKDDTYSGHVITEGSLNPSDYELTTIFSQYSARNLTTYFQPSYPLWTSGRPSGGSFKVHIEMTYPIETIVFYTGFWQMMKYALVQYIAILIVFAFLCERLKLFVFSHQLINTVPIKPFKSS